MRHSHTVQKTFVGDRQLQVACFDALESLDPSLGAVLATSALTGLRLFDMERLSLVAFDPGAGAIRPIFHAPDERRRAPRWTQSLPIAETLAPIAAAMVTNARSAGADSVVAAVDASRRWATVRRHAGLGPIPAHAMRVLFAATAWNVRDFKWPTSMHDILWLTSERVRSELLLPPTVDVRRLDPLFDAVAARLSHVVRPAFGAGPVGPGPAASMPPHETG